VSSFDLSNALKDHRLKSGHHNCASVQLSKLQHIMLYMYKSILNIKNALKNHKKCLQVNQIFELGKKSGV